MNKTELAQEIARLFALRAQKHNWDRRTTEHALQTVIYAMGLQTQSHKGKRESAVWTAYREQH